MDKFLLVGLGNPGEKYQDTRHNIGFKIIDSLSNKFNTSFNIDKYGHVAKIKIKGHQVFLLKPLTFMNLSGGAVRYHLLKNKIKIENLLIISDDLHLPFGKIKIKGQGTAGGHNGHKDIIQKLGTKCYARLKFGIGNKFNLGDQSKHVLSDFSKEEKLVIFDFINLTLDAMINFCTLGLNKTMTNLN